MQLRAMGYDQNYIASMLGLSQSAISQRLHKIRDVTEGAKDPEKLFWTLLLGAGAIYVLSRLLKKQ